MYQNVETRLIKLFTEAAKQKEESMKGKVYDYKLYKGDCFLGELLKKGKCKVVSREYERSIDCDVIGIIDIDTNEKFYASQFALELNEDYA